MPASVAVEPHILLQRDEAKFCDRALADLGLGPRLDRAWHVVLHLGDRRAPTTCDIGGFKHFLRAAGIAQTERAEYTCSGCFVDLQKERGRAELDLPAFAACLVRLGEEHLEIELDRGRALEHVLTTHVDGYVAALRSEQNVDGTGPDSLYLEHADVDRLLYVYDGVFDRLFNIYRRWDNHQGRALTQEQVLILGDYLELEELREMLKDLGFFPKHLAFAELSAAMQYACFKAVQRDPHLAAPFLAGVDSGFAECKAELHHDEVASPVGSRAGEDDEEQAVNPLYVPALPLAYLHEEALLDKPRFMCCFVRIAQMLLNKPGVASNALPTIASRVEEMLRRMEGPYQRATGRDMAGDLDYAEKGLPLVTGITPKTLQPFCGGAELTFGGGNFCEKRGVFVQFTQADGRSTVMRAKEIGKKFITVVLPPAKPDEVEITVNAKEDGYTIDACRTAKVVAECSNNRAAYTTARHTVHFRRDLVQYALTPVLAARLRKSFSAVCSIGAADAYSSNMLSRENWHLIKAHYGIVDDARSGSVAAFSDTAPPSPTDADDRTSNDKAFVRHAALHDGAVGFTLNFAGYLAVLAWHFIDDAGDSGWHARFDAAGDAPFAGRKKRQSVVDLGDNPMGATIAGSRKQSFSGAIPS
jgi:hypothetical protein